MILLDSGQILKGVIQSQDTEQVVIADANGELTTVSQDEIEIHGTERFVDARND